MFNFGKLRLLFNLFFISYYAYNGFFEKAKKLLCQILSIYYGLENICKWHQNGCTIKNIVNEDS